MIRLSPEDNRVLERIHQINLETLLEVDRIAERHGVPYQLTFGGLLGAVRHKDFIPWDNDVDVMITREDFARLKPFLEAELDPVKYELVMPEDYGEKYLDMVPRVNYRLADVHAFPPEQEDYYDGKMNKIALDFFFFDRVPKGIRGRIQVFRLMVLYGLLNSKRYAGNMGQYPNLFYRAAAATLRFLGKPFKTETLRKRVLKLATMYDHDPSVTTYRLTNDTIHSFGIEMPGACMAETVRYPVGEYMFPGPAGADEFLTRWYGDYMTLPPEEEQVPHVFNRLLTADLFTFRES